MPDPNQRRLFLTGASGLLGREIFSLFSSRGWRVYGTALTRVEPQLHKLDLRSVDDIKKAITKFKPNFLIHCAAERRLDRIIADPIGAITLNVGVTGFLAEICAAQNIHFLYISTDDVFDGKRPTYKATDEPCPLNAYGRTKLQGELAASMVNKETIILRIPLLYGPVKYLGESGVTVLLEALLNSEPAEIANNELRFPSYVGDIAHICDGLATKRLMDPSVQGIFQWCGKEGFTKYSLTTSISKVFKLSSKHLKGGCRSSHTRNPRLDTSRLDKLGIGQHTPFKEGILKALEVWVIRATQNK